MKPRYLMYIALLYMAFLFVMSEPLRAAPYTSPPQSLDTTFFAFEGNIAALLWEQTDGTWYCLAGQWFNTINYVNTWPKEQPGESISQYAMRAMPQIAPRERTPEELAVCKKLTDANVVQEVWIVDQYRTSLTRPVYQITDIFPSVKIKLKDGTGKEVRAPHSQACGNKVADYSTTSKVYEWREVTVNSLRGVSVCRRQ